MRLLRKLCPAAFCFFFIILWAFFPVYGDEESEESLRRVTDQDAKELLSLELGDSSVSLQVSGFWKGTLNAGLGMSFSPLGNAFVFDDTPLFMQEADLTLSLWIRERWFVEASFQDDYHLNTYRAGYQGFPGELVQYAGIGNTGLDFPDFPYLDLGEASPSSFGFYGHFEAGDFELHSLVRYDSAVREERVFSNGHERNYSFAEINGFLRGVSFVLPDAGLSGVPVVYIETPGGALTDSTGRRWRMLEPSEYAASAVYGIVELSLGAYTGGLTEPEGMIAVSYSIAGNSNPWNVSLGTYGASGSPGTGFLGDAQAYFDGSSRTINLSAYPQSGGAYSPGTNAPGRTAINGVPVLIIYEKGTFSPFERQNLYQLPADGSANLVRLSSGTVVQGYELLPAENNLRMASRLIRGSASVNSREEKDRWPLVSGQASSTDGLSIPEIYLPGRNVFTGDLGIRVTSLTAVDSFYIGTDVIPGSIQVYRDGLLDPDFSFNAANGTVNLGNVPFFNETIRISYLRTSEDRNAGSIAIGAGLIWNQSSVFNTRLGLGFRWNLSDETYSEQGVSSPGTVGLGAEANWVYDRLRATLTLGLGFVQPDSTGLYRAAGMENNEALLDLPPDNSFISSSPNNYSAQNRAPLVYRDYRDTSLFSNSSYFNITSSSPVVSGESGPYPALDSAFVNSNIQVLAAEFTLDSNQNWTGFQVPLGADAPLLERAQEIEIPFRFLNISDPANKLRIIFQAGTLSGKDSVVYENIYTVIESVMYEPNNVNYRPMDNDRRMLVLSLTNEDRRKLQGANYIRILISAATLTPGETVSGRVILAPPIIKGAGFRPVTIDNGNISSAEISSFGLNNVNALETIESGANRLENSKHGNFVRRFHTGNNANRVLQLEWKNLAGNYGPGADHRLSNLPLINYKSLSFFMRRPQTAGNQAALDAARLRFFMGNGPQSLNNSRETILDAEIPLRALADIGIGPGEWARVEIRYQGSNQGVYIDGNFIRDASLDFYPGFADINSVYLAFLVMPGAFTLPDGNIAFDEIILEESISSYRLNAGGSIDFRLPGTMVSAGDVPVIEDIAVSMAAESGTAGNPFEENTNSSFGINNRIRAELSILGIRTTGNYSFSLLSRSYSPDIDYSWRAGHGLSRNFGPLTIRESFDLDPFAGTFGHQASVLLNAPFDFSLQGNLAYGDLRYDRRWQSSIGHRMSSFPLGFSMGVNAGWMEIIEPPDYMDNYAIAWIGSFAPLMPNTGNDALRRDGRANFNADLETKPAGLRLFGEGITSFYTIDKSTLSGTLLRLDIPLALDINSQAYAFMFRKQREFRRNVFFDGRDFNDDLQRFGEAAGDGLPLMFGIPFYSFFNPDLPDTMLNANSGMYPGTFLNSGHFTELFEFSLQMPANYTVSSLYVPSRISLYLNRFLEQKMDVLSDTLGFGTALNFSAVNLFGALGSSPAFSFYAFDEINHSLEVSVSMPRSERVTYRVQAAQDLGFFGFEGEELILGHVLNVSSANFLTDENRVTDTLSLAWTVPMETTLLGSLYAAVMGKAETQSSWLTLAELGREEYELFRRESLDFTYEYDPGETSSSSNFSLVIGHESIVRILGRLNLSAYAKLSISNDFSSNIFRILGTIGTSLSVMF